MMRMTIVGKWDAALAIVLFLPSIVQAEIADSRIFESRYLTVQVGPKQAQTDLLQSIVDIQVPEKTTTIGESLSYLLRPYGFQIDEDPASDEQYLLLVLALPEPHRQLGPMTLMDALTTLGGNSFRPVINPVKRTVRYQFRDGFTRFANETDREGAKKQWSESKEVVPASLNESKLIADDQQTYGPVLRGDSLGQIVNQLDFKYMTTHQSLVYLFLANPHAFANRNMNHLLEGEVLTIPVVEIEALPSAVEASRLVNEHHRLWKKREVTP